MAKLSLVAGTTSKIVKIFVQDSSKTTGVGLTGLAYNTSGLTAYYIKEGDSSTTAISLATATLGTWSTGGFIVVDGTNMPGVYELGIPNAALASGKSCLIYLQGATNMAPVLLEIELTAIDNQSTGFGLVDVSSNVVQIAGQTASASGTVTFPNATLASTANITGGTITTVTNLTNAPTTGDFTSTMKTSIGTAVAASDVAGITGVTFPSTVASPTNITAATGIDITKILGTAISTPATAGILDVNIKNVNNVGVNGNGQSGTEWGP